MKQLNTIRNERYIKNLKYSYDRQNDLLYIYRKDSHVYSNVMIGEFHIEFDKVGKIVGVEVLNAIEILREYNVEKRILENIDNVGLKVVTRNNSLILFIEINALNETKSAAVTMNNLEMPIMQSIAEA
ncbi:DUF2283 domain-containing protein [Candidatus Woesearchaeota archaeon]|nr:DUF2283 domain-containing protein [Candidatus Woesearchaeota archaeon]